MELVFSLRGARGGGGGGGVSGFACTGSSAAQTMSAAGLTLTTTPGMLCELPHSRRGCSSYTPFIRLMGRVKGPSFLRL